MSMLNLTYNHNSCITCICTITKDHLVLWGMQISPNLHFQGYLTSWPQITFDLDLWPLTAWTYEGFHIISINQVWFFQLFKWGHFHLFSLSYNLTSGDLWPWYMTFDLINKWGFPCCIYDPGLVEIHQSMWTIEPNVDPFHNRQQQQQRETKWSLCVLLRQATQ